MRQTSWKKPQKITSLDESEPGLELDESLPVIAADTVVAVEAVLRDGLVAVALLRHLQHDDLGRQSDAQNTKEGESDRRIVVSDGLDIANEIAIFLLGRFQSSFAGLSCLARTRARSRTRAGERVNRLLRLANRVTHRNRPRNGTKESPKKMRKVLQRN